MKNINNNSLKKEEVKSWKRHFSGKNLLINALISFIPAALVIGIMMDIGLRGAVPILLVWSGLILIIGIIREKILKLFQ